VSAAGLARIGTALADTVLYRLPPFILWDSVLCPVAIIDAPTAAVRVYRSGKPILAVADHLGCEVRGSGGDRGGRPDPAATARLDHLRTLECVIDSVADTKRLLNIPAGADTGGACS